MSGFWSKSLMSVLLLCSCAICNAEFPLVFKQNSEHQSYNSLAYKVLQPVYQRAGVRIKPSNKQLNNYDGYLISQRDIDKERSGYVRIPVAIVTVRLLAYTQQRHQHTSYQYGLMANRIAVVKGSALAERYAAGVVTYAMDTVERAFVHLRKNNVDIVLMPELDALAKASGQLGKGVVALSPAVKEIAMYHYVHKKHQQLIPRIKRALTQLERNHGIMAVQQEMQKNLSHVPKV